jgi:CheY-like chemotaxis protein
MSHQEKRKITKQHVLIVDDRSVNLQHLEHILKSQYRVSFAKTCDQCLDLIAKDSIDLVLLDLDTPMMDGLSVCRMIKADPATMMIPVIFVSNLASPTDRLVGYQVGAEDYVEKPYDDDDLLLKVRIALDHRHDLVIARQCDMLVKEEMAASQAISTELGEVAKFINDILECDNLRLLGERLLMIFERIGLRVIVRMIPSGHYFSHAGEVGVLDQEMMENMREKGRFVDFGHRTLINAESVSVLVRNMPVHDSERHLHLKETLKLLVVAVSRRISDLRQLQNKQKGQEGLRPLVTELHQLIDRLQDIEYASQHKHAPHHLNRLFVAWEAQQL